MTNVRNGKVIQQTLINTSEAVTEAANASSASNDDLRDNIVILLSAILFLLLRAPRPLSSIIPSHSNTHHHYHIPEGKACLQENSKISHPAVTSSSGANTDNPNSYDPGPAYQRVAPPTSLPATVLGTDEVPPGSWAEHIMKAPWARAREGR
ncbi:hypothetical protein N7530_008030 [Penicillium desertorum]|uniref:Uncharacterized protein n=1 Tax=Penicillium desertorum TaxID=1303715 RepID=A0A9W9WNY3_9EURO|nr:hypothetical protein N7530_008030 [Penicillium desertorum]